MGSLASLVSWRGVLCLGGTRILWLMREHVSPREVSRGSGALVIGRECRRFNPFGPASQGCSDGPTLQSVLGQLSPRPRHEGGPMSLFKALQGSSRLSKFIADSSLLCWTSESCASPMVSNAPRWPFATVSSVPDRWGSFLWRAIPSVLSSQRP